MQLVVDVGIDIDRDENRAAIAAGNVPLQAAHALQAREDQLNAWEQDLRRRDASDGGRGNAGDGSRGNGGRSGGSRVSGGRYNGGRGDRTTCGRGADAGGGGGRSGLNTGAPFTPQGTGRAPMPPHTRNMPAAGNVTNASLHLASLAPHGMMLGGLTADSIAIDSLFEQTPILSAVGTRTARAAQGAATDDAPPLADDAPYAERTAPSEPAEPARERTRAAQSARPLASDETPAATRAAASPSPAAAGTRMQPPARAGKRNAPPPRVAAKPQRNPAQRQDLGDACDVSDSDMIQRRQQVMRDLVDVPEWNELPERLRTAILKSTMVVTVSDLIGAARHGGLTGALVRLGQVLQRDDAALCGSPVQQNAVMVQALRKIALSDLTLHPNIVQKFNAVLHCAMTAATAGAQARHAHCRIPRRVRVCVRGCARAPGAGHCGVRAQSAGGELCAAPCCAGPALPIGVLPPDAS